MAANNKQSRTWSSFAAIALLFLQHTPTAWAQPDHEKCFAALKVADENGNGHLTHHEYIQFLNVLSENQRYFESYSDLAESLHLNFQIFQESEGVIDIRGATLGAESTYQQQRLVETLCTTTPITLDTLPTMAPQIENVTATNQTNATATNVTLPLLAPTHPNATSVNGTNITSPLLAPPHPNTTSEDLMSKQGVFVYPFVPDTEGGPANPSAMSKDGSNVAADESASGIPPEFNQTIYLENVVTDATTEPDPSLNIVSSATVTRAPSELDNETSTTPPVDMVTADATDSTAGPVAEDSAAGTEDPVRGNSTTATEPPVTSDPPASTEPTAATEAPISELSTASPSAATAEPTNTSALTAAPTTPVATATIAPTAAPTTTATTIAPTTMASTAAPTAAPTQTNTAAPTSVTTPPEAIENITAVSTLSNSSSTTPVTQAPTEAPTVSPTSISPTANPANETVDLSASTLTLEPATSSPPDITQSPTESSSEEMLPPKNETIAPSLQLTQEQNDTAGTASNESTPATLSPTDDLYSECKAVMRFSDINEDGTMNKVEYVWFLNDNWGNQYAGAGYKNLPKTLKDNFDNLAKDGEIDISAMSSQEPMTTEEEEFLNKICSDTDAAISQDKPDDENPDEDSAEEEASMATFKDCLEKVSLFDVNSDSLIDVNEYSAFIGELSEGLLGTRGFATLPQDLQNTFHGLANGDTLDLRGANMRMKRSSSSQQEVVEEICVDVSYSLNEVLRDYEPIQADADTESMLEYAECFMGMELYDVDQDSALDKEEYVGLVNRLGEDMFKGLEFEELQEALQDNFFNLETNGTINITGFKTEQVPDKEQSEFLAMVCTETTNAVRAVLDPTSEPTEEIDVDVAAGGDPIVIHSSFMLYSDVFISDEELETGETRRSLEEAYKLFAEEVVNGLVQDAGSTRQRKLEEDENDKRPSVIFDPNSPIITKFVDLNCMASSKDAICKTVYAQYEIIPAERMDRDAMYEEYVRVTQTHIDSGMLQKDLEQVDPSLLIAIIGASEPVIYSPPESTTAPMDVPFYEGPEEAEVEASESTGSSTKKKIMALITVAVGLVLFVSVVALIYLQYRKRLEDNASSTSGSLQSRSTKSKSPSETGDLVTIIDEAATISGGEAVTINGDEFFQEGSRGSSNGSHGSRKMNDNSFRSGRHSHSDDEDEELGKMQLIDLSQADSYGVNDFGARNNAHMHNNVPPLRRKKNAYNDGDDDERELCSPMSEEMSFAFRRFELEGAGAKTGDSEDLYAI